MARSQEHDIDAQIEALVDIFIEGITPREALAILDEGPSALEGACFAWAFPAAEQIDGIDELDPCSAMSLIERAPIVNQLREAAVEAFVERFGEPRPPGLPARPDGFGAEADMEHCGSQHRRMSNRARILCHTLVNGRCISWQTIYYVTRSRDRSQFVLWVEWEDGDSSRPFVTTQQAWLEARKGLSEHDAALILLEDYWKSCVCHWGTPRPSELTACGRTITQDELELVAERAWPTA